MNARPRIVCVGAGRMGRGIAIAFAYAGHEIDVVDLKVRDDSAWATLDQQAVAEVRASLHALAALGALPAAGVPQIAARVRWVRESGANEAIAAADVIFEAVPETIPAKREALSRVGSVARADAVVASTTSTILVTDLVPLVAHPQRLLNAHWLNPAYLMPLVELSPHPLTCAAARASLADLLDSIGKVTVECAPTPGYIVPRLQALIMNEAARMVDEGVATAAEIDRATRYGLGLRFAAMGVVEFIDYGGVDILHHASRYLATTVSAQRYTAPEVVDRMMAEGRIGLKSGDGFFDHRSGDPQADRLDVLRRVLAMVRHAGLYREAAIDPPE